MVLVVGGALLLLGLGVLLGRGVGGNDAKGPKNGDVPQLSCSEATARRAVERSKFGNEARRLGAVPADKELFDTYGIKVVGCRDLNNDDRRELVVQLTCCTSGSPFPWAIFEQNGDHWRPALIRDRVSAAIRLDGPRVVEKSPAYAQGDAYCCPSGIREGTVEWDGRSFIYRSKVGSQERLVVIGGAGAQSIGSFDVRHGSPSGAVSTFGVASNVDEEDVACRMRWSDIGLLIVFANFGGRSPCGPEGLVGSISIEGLEAEQAGWEVGGLSIGASQERMLRAYPNAWVSQQRAYVGPDEEKPGTPYVLATRRFFGDSRIPALVARSYSGRIVGLDLYVGAAGE